MSKVPINDTPQEARAKVIGAGLTLAVHIAAMTILFSSGFKVIYPPPAELGIEVDLEMEPPKPIQVKSGHEPRVENPNPEKEVKLVQRSESAIKGNRSNTGAEATSGESGDVEHYEPPKPKPIDRRALFPSAQNQNSTDPQVSKQISESLSAGHAEGNTQIGSTDGEPSARLAGRSLMGNLPEPDYSVNAAGKVVVKIMVDQYGTVIDASPGAPGTTVQNRTLWEASKRAALKAKFNLSSSAPAVQEGTITYIFRLK
ncbi:hypothetical protein MASR1M46_11080 [Bacteroidales bacterium]